MLSPICFPRAHVRSQGLLAIFLLAADADDTPRRT